jgi:hypothetical protein
MTPFEDLRHSEGRSCGRHGQWWLVSGDLRYTTIKWTTEDEKKPA